MAEILSIRRIILNQSINQSIVKNCGVDNENNVNKVIRGKAMLTLCGFDIIQHCDFDDMNDVNDVIRGKQCRHDVDSISYNISMSRM